MLVGVIVANLPSLAPYLRMMGTRPSKPAPRPSSSEPIRKNTWDKYKCGPLDEESGCSTLQNAGCMDDGGKKALGGELAHTGIIPAEGAHSQSNETWDDVEMFDVGALASSRRENKGAVNDPPLQLVCLSCRPKAPTLRLRPSS
jgi:hypothetical protein